MLNNAEKYWQFEAEDFAADESFLAWVLSGKQAEAWEAWLIQNKDKATTIKEAKQLVAFMRSEEKEINNQQIEFLWNKIDKATENKQVKIVPFHQSTIGRAGMGIAASIMLLLGFFLWNQPNNSFETGFGEQLAVTLPDGSVATLNAGSSILFDENSWKENREVKLSGEAFFEVEKGERFTVKTSLGEVTVLGTSFNVQERNKRLQVACYTGKVSVKNEYAVSQILTPGKRISVEKDKVKLDEFKAEKTVAWKEGIFRFDDIELKYVLEELQRQYNVTIDLATDINNRRYSGSFTKGDLEEALKMICLPMELSYQIAEDNAMVIIDEE